MLSDFLTLNPLTRSYFGTPDDCTEMRKTMQNEASI